MKWDFPLLCPGDFSSLKWRQMASAFWKLSVFGTEEIKFHGKDPGQVRKPSEGPWNPLRGPSLAGPEKACDPLATWLNCRLKKHCFA